MQNIDQNGYTYLRIFATDKIKEKEMKEKFVKLYLRKSRLPSKPKLHGRGKIMTINTWVVSVLSYRIGNLKCNTEELKSLDKKMRNIMTMHEMKY